MAFEWDNSYSVKVASCDEQHRKLFDIMNELTNSMRMGKGRDSVEGTLNQLLEYAQNHFVDEEALLEKANYPRLAEHQQMHRVFLSRVQSMQTLARAGKRTSAMQVLQLGRDWLVNHIQKVDKQYSAHLNSAGIR